MLVVLATKRVIHGWHLAIQTEKREDMKITVLSKVLEYIARGC